MITLFKQFYAGILDWKDSLAIQSEKRRLCKKAEEEKSGLLDRQQRLISTKLDYELALHCRKLSNQQYSEATQEIDEAIEQIDKNISSLTCKLDKDIEELDKQINIASTRFRAGYGNT